LINVLSREQLPIRDVPALARLSEEPLRAFRLAEDGSHLQRFGTAVASLRRDRGLEQSMIPGVSERQVRRIEAGSVPRVSTLEKLAHAHRMNVDEYLAEIAARAAGGELSS
jgi:hypothetical protein